MDRWQSADDPTGAAFVWPFLVVVACICGYVVSRWDVLAGVVVGLGVFVLVPLWVYVKRHEPRMRP